MGCGASKWRDPDRRQRGPGSVGEVVVFLPGLRVPRSIDFSRSLGDHLDKSIVERLSALRARVVAMAMQESEMALKPRRKVAARHVFAFQEGLVLLIFSRLWKSTCQFCLDW